MWEPGDDKEVNHLHGLGNISQGWGDDSGDEEEEERQCQAQTLPGGTEATSQRVDFCSGFRGFHYK